MCQLEAVLVADVVAGGRTVNNESFGCPLSPFGIRARRHRGRCGRKTEFVEACDFMGIQRFLYIGPYILFLDLFRTVGRGMQRTAFRPKA
jgi:hypothetical protein